MNRRSLERLSWMVTATVLVLFAHEMLLLDRGGSHDGPIGRGVMQNSPRMPALIMFEVDSLDSAASHIVAHDPFRLERKPASVAYNTSPTGIVATVAPVIPMLRIALQGTIGGPPWHAIISGVPGHAGTIIVSSGDTLGGISIRKVNRDSVTIRVKDSTWTVAMTKAGEE